MKKVIECLASSQEYFIHFIRISIFIVMAWIGGLKAYQYEADGIVPFVTNSPLMSFFYTHSGERISNDDGNEVDVYTLYKNPEGKTVQKNIDWHKDNGLGTVIVLIGFSVLLGIWYPKVGLWGGLLTFGMSLVTLSFLITTPEVYVPNLGGDFPTPQYGFPYLSGAGRLVIKDVIMMAGGLIVASNCAQKLVKEYRNK